MFLWARGTVVPALLLIMLTISCLVACDSGSGGKDGYNVAFRLDASCSSINDYLLEFKAPYSRAFSGDFSASQAKAVLEDFPAGEQQTVITLNGADAYKYDTRLDSSWGAAATYTATCDEVTPKPFLALDLADNVFALSVPEECNWFPRGEWYEVVKAGPSGDQEALQLLYSGNPNEQHRRMIHMFQNGANDEIGTRTFLLRMTDANGKLYDFRYEFSTAEKHFYSYVISCNTASVTFDALLYIDGEEYVPPSDGDSDGDVEATDGESAESDGDTESADGDGSENDDAESEIEVESDGDDSDGDTEDLPDGDAEPEIETEPEEEAPLCDITETPETAWSLLAKDGFIKEESTPSEAASLVESNNPSFTETSWYARLDGTEVGHELVLALDIDTTYMYSILIKCVKGVGWGMTEVYLDDSEEPLQMQDGSTVIDLHVSSTGSYDTVLPSNYSIFKPVCLSYGSHRLRFRVSGRNDNADSYTLGVYKITSTLYSGR